MAKRWTDLDDTYILLTLDEPASLVAKDLGRSEGSIYTRRWLLLKQKPEATTPKRVKPKQVKAEVSITAPQPAKAEPYKLTDSMLEDFHLFDPVTADTWVEENPSLWTRIKQWFKR